MTAIALKVPLHPLNKSLETFNYLGGITYDKITFDYAKGARRGWPRVDSSML